MFYMMHFYLFMILPSVALKRVIHKRFLHFPCERWRLFGWVRVGSTVVYVAYANRESWGL